MPTYQSLPVLSTPIEWTETPSQNWEYDDALVSLGFGAPAAARTQQAAARIWEVTFDFRTVAEIQAMQSFLDGVRGGWGAFWLPTPNQAARINSSPTTTTIRVPTSGSVNWWNEHPRREIWIQSAAEWGTESGTAAVVTGVSTISATEEEWTIDTAISGITTTHRIRWLRRVRLTENREQLHWVAEGKARQVLRVREVPIDFAAPANGPVSFNEGTFVSTYLSTGLYTDPDMRFDASAITGLSNNDPVASWPDAFGHGWAATQATSSKRPTYKTNQLNGLPGVLFGSDDKLETDNKTRWEQITIGFVITLQSVASPWVESEILGSASDRLFALIASGSSGNRQLMFAVQYGSVSDTIDTGIPYGTTGPLMCWLTADYGGTQIQSNSIDSAESAIGSTWSRFEDGALRLGAPQASGRPTAPCLIHDVVIFHRLLSASELAVWQGKLAHQWGIQSTQLPVSHPYRSTPPPW